VSPSEVAREGRPAGALATALEGHGVEILEIGNVVGLACLGRNARSAQRQGQLPREIVAGITPGTVNDQNPCPWHRRALLHAQRCEDCAGESPQDPRPPTRKSQRSADERAKSLRGGQLSCIRFVQPPDGTSNAFFADRPSRFVIPEVIRGHVVITQLGGRRHI
jgi:hypothetical protein